MKVGVFIANFQPFHKSHEFLIQKAIQENDMVYVFVKYTDNIRKEDTPFTVKERRDMIYNVFPQAIFGDRLVVVPFNLTCDKKVPNLYQDIVKVIKQTSFSLYYSNTSKYLLKNFSKEQLDYVNFCFVDRNERFSGLTTRKIRTAILNDNNDYLVRTLPCEIHKTKYQLKRVLSNL